MYPRVAHLLCVPACVGQSCYMYLSYPDYGCFFFLCNCWAEYPLLLGARGRLASCSETEHNL